MDSPFEVGWPRHAERESLAKNPLANKGSAMKQYDAPVLALTQESNDLNVHKSDLIQVHEYANAVIVYLTPYVADIGRLNSTTEPRGCSVSVRLLFNPQHWQLPLYQPLMRAEV
jgi:hypothetical protein